MKLLTPGKDGKAVIDFEDVVMRSVTVVKDGATTWPPPPVQVSAAPVAKAEAVVIPEKKKMSGRTRAALIALGLAALFGVVTLAPAPLPEHFLVLMLSVVIGFYVIGKVHHALHTPLMSGANAIHGVVLVGAILVTGKATDNVQLYLGLVAIVLASINMVGGFVVTDRMLEMFKPKKAEKEEVSK